ncbi:VOC family protein [Streptomyces sp. HNM0574]|uniref:VOC family protein n=1 Tax=Streptomyces sp. HNM0574 TaxID=2714954 RepID=UPI00146A3394|nr:VOC family protein [Streptomyces sp. HNM0574]NLU68079.1 VOC family protein [Streptomyces sp. HNM0574]
MAALPEGTPCWADAMFTDLEGAKSFYGDVLGWTFGESATEYGNYTEAYSDGKAVAAIVPPMPGQEEQSAWCLYFASDDVVATARRVRDMGGDVLMEPMRVGDFGSMLLARDPAGVVFGAWQAGRHEGFEKRGERGSFCWAEVFTRDPESSDAFFPGVFPYRVRRLEDEEIDFKIFDLGDETVLGRMRMGADFPPEVPPHIQLYFAVFDCDAAVVRATDRGGKLRFGPMTTPFGRFAVLSDPQGATFAAIDTGTTEGEMPNISDAA